MRSQSNADCWGICPNYCGIRAVQILGFAIVAAICLGAPTLGAGPQGARPIVAANALLRPSARVPILVPERGAIRAFLLRLDQSARRCDADAAREPLDASRIDERVAEAVATVRSCRGLSERAAAPPSIDLEDWRASAPELSPPSVAERAEALTLSFEATPFDRAPIWNICQDTPGDVGDRAKAVSNGAECLNRSDPCSLLTWGPRGATAGQGREIQWILWRLERESPDAVREAFGEEATALLRLSRFSPPPNHGCDGSSALEAALCEVWSSAKRRSAWDKGFQRLGRDARARRAFRSVYALTEFDGYKLNAYRALWRRLGVTPNEIDFAFFFDRSTHSGAPPAGVSVEQLRRCMADDDRALSRNAAARRCLSAAHPHPDAPIDRIGRDMAYYRSGYPEGALSAREIRIWNRHIPLDAAWNLGLSEARAADPALFRSAHARPADRPPFAGAAATRSEQACAQRLWPQ